MANASAPNASGLPCVGTAGTSLPADLGLCSLELTLPLQAVRPAIQTWLREILGTSTGDNPAMLLLAEGPHGKPYLTDKHGVPRPPAFNLSHSGNVAVLVVSSIGRHVGVDIEIPKPGRDLLRLVDGFLSPAEQAQLPDVPQGDLQMWLLRRWSAKEAVAKAWGLGLSAGLRRIEIADGQPPTWRAVEGLQPPEGEWRLAELEVPGGVGWLAWDDGEPT